MQKQTYSQVKIQAKLPTKANLVSNKPGKKLTVHSGRVIKGEGDKTVPTDRNE